MTLGKCPHCHNIIGNNDIEDINFRGNMTTHYAYVCRKCQHIISIGVAFRG
ncbi:MAG: hypothetical protein NWE83_12795 [Candidatus Bathyarchaeota archaeon]|nr:hypothetical protein [Candidatus Bathyarchaeota archaeon]